MERNVKADNDAKGYSFYMTYGINSIVRSSLEYTFYKPININPTWYNIKAHSVEANVHFLARFPEWKAYFYPICGLSFNQFSGYFTGQNDYLGLSLRYGTNTRVSTNWLGINFGSGYEHHIGPVCFLLEYKMRLGAMDGLYRKLNLVDVFLGAGLKYNFRVRSVYSIINGTGTRKRYFLDTE